MKTEDLFDFVICGLISVWVYVVFTYEKHEIKNPSIAVLPDEILMYDIMMQNYAESFHFDFLLAIIASMFWLRMILMLKLTKIFGPLIKIITVML